MPSKNHNRCLVCGDVAIGINFGVPTCMPCKAFFRRNAVRLGVSPISSSNFEKEAKDYFFYFTGTTICMSK